MGKQAAVVVTLAGLAACGGGGGGGAASGVAIRVVESTLTAATIEHWVSVLAGGRAPSAGTERYELLRRNAAELLISAAWASDEAAARGVKISAAHHERSLRALEQSEFPSGGAEMRSFLAATGETQADVELEATAALATAQLRALIARDTPAATHAEVASYYQSHRASFAVPERREVVQTNAKTEAAALQDRRAMAADKGLLSDSQTETLIIRTPQAVEPPIGPAERAIAAAKLDTLEGPVKQRVDYYVFEVKRIFPAYEQTLAQVSARISSQLTSERRAQALAAFERAWVRKWSARTSCTAGYVVAACRQYRGARNLKLGFGLR